MSSRQERELAMRDRMIVSLAQVVQLAREFVDEQAPLGRDDFALPAFDALERKLKALLRNDWARSLLKQVEKSLDATGRDA